MNVTPPDAVADRALRTDRRTVLRTTAWSVPAVTLAMAAPAFAASGSQTLQLNLTSYATTACSELSGAYATLSEAGMPVAGENVTVTLTGGFTFADGSETFVGTTDAAGVVSLPAIVTPLVQAPATPQGSVTANAGNLQSVAMITGTALGPVVAAYRGPVAADWPTSTAVALVPGTQALGRTAFLTPTGELQVLTNGVLTTVATGVTSAVADVNSNNETIIGYVDATGGHFRGANGTVTDYPALNPGTVAVGRDAFLGPAGTLFVGTAQVATGVASATARVDSGNGTAVAWVRSTGGASMRNSNGTVTNWPSVPANYTAVGLNVFLGPGGQLIKGNDDGSTSLIATGVKSAYADYSASDGVMVSYVTSSGGYNRTLGTGSDNNWNLVPSNAVVVGRQTFLTPDGRLFVGNAVVDRGVISAAGRMNNTNNSIVGYVKSPSC